MKIDGCIKIVLYLGLYVVPQMRLFFLVVDLCVFGISARCNQATVAFLRLLISTLFFSIMEVECSRAKFFLLYFSYPMPVFSEKVRVGTLSGNGRIAQLLRRMKITASGEGRMDKPRDQHNLMKIIIL